MKLAIGITLFILGLLAAVMYLAATHPDVFLS
jgi:hypothetical protein